MCLHYWKYPKLFRRGNCLDGDCTGHLDLCWFMSRNVQENNICEKSSIENNWYRHSSCHKISHFLPEMKKKTKNDQKYQRSIKTRNKREQTFKNKKQKTLACMLKLCQRLMVCSKALRILQDPLSI